MEAAETRTDGGVLKRAMIAAMSLLFSSLLATSAAAQVCIGGAKDPGTVAVGAVATRLLDAPSESVGGELAALSDQGIGFIGRGLVATGDDIRPRPYLAHATVAYAPTESGVQVCPTAGWQAGRSGRVQTSALSAGLAVGTLFIPSAGAFARADLLRRWAGDVDDWAGEGAVGVAIYGNRVQASAHVRADFDGVEETARVALSIRWVPR